MFSIFTLVNKIESFVSSTPEAALCTGALFADAVKRQMEAYSCLHKPLINTKSWSTMSLDEAILRARLIAALINKGAIILVQIPQSIIKRIVLVLVHDLAVCISV